VSPFGSSRGLGGGGFFAGCGFFAGFGAPLPWAAVPPVVPPVVPPFAAPVVPPGFVAVSGVPLLGEAPGAEFWFPVDDGTRVATGATRSGGCGTVLRGGVPFDATVPLASTAGGGVVTDRDAATVRGT
jgi:hypothetical protein